MKSKIIKITLIVLAIAIVIGGFVAVSYINRPKVYDYYVKKDGKGDGLSAETPVATITDVFEKSNEKVNKWDTVNVNFLYSEEETEMDIVISPKTVKSNVTIFIDNINMNVLSMGMSDDYPIAIEYGSTMVRIGSMIFGERNY